MDPNPTVTDPNITVADPDPSVAPTTSFPILSQVIDALPAAITRSFAISAEDNPHAEQEPEEPHFETFERMPDITNPELVAAMRDAVNDVAESRSVLEALGPRPDHETVDVARSRLVEIDACASGDQSEEDMQDYKACRAVIELDEMHDAYEKMLDDAERRLESIYDEADAADLDADDDEYEEGEDDYDEYEEAEEVIKGDEMMNEEVAAILKAAEAGKKVIEKVDLSGRKLKILPDEFGALRTLIVLNLSYNKLEVRIIY